jgi:hypothetical protein
VLRGFEFEMRYPCVSERAAIRLARDQSTRLNRRTALPFFAGKPRSNRRNTALVGAGLARESVDSIKQAHRVTVLRGQATLLQGITFQFASALLAKAQVPHIHPET